jgi:hypothetical protein
LVATRFKTTSGRFWLSAIQPSLLYGSTPVSERRASGEVVHVELALGMVIVVPAWMLDPPPALESNSVHRASRYQRWLSCISY